MAKYPLDMLITARKIREGNAQRDVLSAKNELEQLYQNIENKKIEMEQYENWRKEEEVRRFLEIQNTVLNQKEMDRFKWGIAGLKAHTLELEDEVVEMEGKIDGAKKKIEDAVVVHKEAISQKEKIEEHKAHWKAEQDKEAGRLEDLELEEFKTKSKDDDDIDDVDMEE